jgi:hypothetical protein
MKFTDSILYGIFIWRLNAFDNTHFSRYNLKNLFFPLFEVVSLPLRKLFIRNVYDVYLCYSLVIAISAYIYTQMWHSKHVFVSRFTTE